MAFRTVELRRWLGPRRYVGVWRSPQQALARVLPARIGGLRRRHRLARWPGGHRHPLGDHPRLRQDPVFRSFPADRFG